MPYPRTPYLKSHLWACLGWVIIAASSIAYAKPPAYRTWQPIPEFTDEFNGTTLDAAKWYDHNPHFSGMHPAIFRPTNVALEKGELELTARAEELHGVPAGYRDFSTASIKSRKTVLYGYFEVRARAMNSVITSAFWFYNDQDPAWWTEIDVFEIYGGDPARRARDHMAAHVFRTPTYRGTVPNHRVKSHYWDAARPLAEEYHVYGLEWDADAIKWYVDDNLVWALHNTAWHQPLYLTLDNNIMPDMVSSLRAADLPAVYSIDYVRAWRRVDQPDPSPDPNAMNRDLLTLIARIGLGVAGAVLLLLALIEAVRAIQESGRSPAPSAPNAEHAAWRQRVSVALSSAMGVALTGSATLAMVFQWYLVFVLNYAVEFALVAVTAGYAALAWRFGTRQRALGFLTALTGLLVAIGALAIARTQN